MSQLFFDYFPETRDQLVFTIRKNASGSVSLSPCLLPVDKSGRPGKLKELIPPLPLLEGLTMEEEKLLNESLHSRRGTLDFTEGAASFIHSKARLYCRQERRFFRLVPVSGFNLALEFFQLLPQGNLEFKPVFYCSEDPDRRPFSRWNFYLTDDHLLILDQDRATLFYSPATPLDLALLTLMKHYIFRVPLSRLDKLSVWKTKLNAPKIRLLPLPETLSLKEYKPQTILKIRPGTAQCHLGFWFSYGGEEIPFLSSEEIFFSRTEEAGRHLVLAERMRGYEKNVISSLKKQLDSCLHKETGLYNRLVSKEESYDIEISLGLRDFLIEHTDFLFENDIELRINEKRIIKAGEISYQVRTGNDWLDVQVEFQDAPGALVMDAELMENRMIQSGDQYLILSKEQMEELLKLQRLGMDPLGHMKTALDNLAVVDLVYHRALEKENLLEEKKILSEKLKNQDHQPRPLPSRWNATLRPYQEAGYQRLFFWHQFGFNGCLADDMGLGKTVQTLALLQRLFEEGKLRPSLLVAPVVTLPNWESEVRRFCPDLKIRRHSGKERLLSCSDLEKEHLILVSYQTLRNDLELFQAYPFYYLILDEAHYIKNASSQTFKVVRSLTSRHKLSLTGTPLENSTGELWSQMNFLNPWLLGTMQEFKKNYAYPIEKNGDENAADALKDLITPFLLRRRKEEVLEDLPPKEEITMMVEMSEAQKGAYQRLKTLYRQRVKELLASENPRQASVAILSFMLKLRQMALVPALADQRFRTVPSCKLDSLDLLLQEILEENHKVLIFTQFTTVIEVMEQRLRQALIPYVKLTGATRNREKPVKVFQEDPNIKVFLLSLKAGGVGINLTAADYVILFDPWWNPASEAQAVDRAHRMGQNRKVFSYRLIAKGTIEEKILALQERKRDLADSLITDTRGSLTQLSRQEIMNLFL